MFNIFNMRKSASSKDIIMDFAKAWQTLNTKLIEKHLSSDFIYDSQWVFESLDYKGYIKYIRGKFQTLPLPVTPSVTAERKSMKPSNTRHSSAGISLAITKDISFGGMQPLKYRLLTS